MMGYTEWKDSITRIAEAARKKNRPQLAAAYLKISEGDDSSWVRQALRCIDYLAQRQENIAADDVWEALENSGYSKPNNPRSMGVAFKIASKSNMIEPTGKYRPTRIKKANGRPIRIWQVVE